MNGDYQNYYIIDIGQNTEKSPTDLERLVVTQTPFDLKNSLGVPIIIHIFILQ